MQEGDVPDPDELLRLAREGDREALGDLWEYYRRYLRLLARLQIHQRLQGKVSPSDIVQETFLQAQCDLEIFRGTTGPELLAWLRQILMTKIAKLVRHYFQAQRRNVRLEQQLAEEMNRSSQALGNLLVSKESSPSDQASRREESLWLANALEELPEDYREVLILRHLETLTFPQIAERMQRSVDSVEKLWARALTWLRRAYRGLQ